MSPRLGDVEILTVNYQLSSGGQLQDIIKASIALCDWHFEISQISKTPNALQHFDVLGICISISVHAIDRCVRDCTYRRGLRCCLFGTIGNARALRSGTATVQSRFFCVGINTCLNFYKYDTTSLCNYPML